MNPDFLTFFMFLVKVVKYDSLLDTWTMMPSLIHERSCLPAVFILHDVLYAAGGSSSLNSVEYLDLQTEGSQWTLSNVNLLGRFCGSDVVVVKDKVYLAGGRHVLTPVPTLLEWSADALSWTSLANMSVAKGCHCVVSDGQNYIWSIVPKLMEKYTITSNTWETVNAEPESILNYNCICSDDHIIVKECADSASIKVLFHAYSVKENLWTTYGLQQNLMTVCLVIAFFRR